MSNYLALLNFNLTSINASTINYSTLVGSTIIANSISNSSINVSSITGQTINYSTLTGSTLTAQNVNYSTLSGSTLTAQSVNYSTLSGSTLNANTMGINSTVTASSITSRIINYSTLTGSTIGANTVSIASMLTATNITTTGNVGIGTNSSNVLLDLRSSSASNFIIQTVSPGETYGLGSSLKNTYATAGTLISIGTFNAVASAGSLIDYSMQGTGGNTNVYAGGIAGPNGNGPGIFVIGRRTAVTTWAESLRIDTSGTLLLSNAFTNRRIIVYDVGTNDHQFYGFGVNSSILRYQVNDTTSDHIFYAGTNSTTSNELMRIKGNGNVGIGTNPGFRLEVNGISATRSVFYNSNGNYAGPAIGLYGGTGDKLILYAGDSSSYPYSIGIAAGTMWFSVPAGAVYKWHNNGNQIMSLSTGGDITVTGGINSTSSLIVSGTATYQTIGVQITNTSAGTASMWQLSVAGSNGPQTQGALYIYGNRNATNGGFPIVVQPTSGNVGIGTSNAQYTLDVAGSARVTGKFYNGQSYVFGASTNLNSYIDYMYSVYFNLGSYGGQELTFVTFTTFSVWPCTYLIATNNYTHGAGNTSAIITIFPSSPPSAHITMLQANGFNQTDSSRTAPGFGYKNPTSTSLSITTFNIGWWGLTQTVIFTMQLLSGAP